MRDQQRRRPVLRHEKMIMENAGGRSTEFFRS
jgi:hypothetical protein